MLVAEHRFQPAGQWRVGQYGVEIHWGFGDRDDMAARRYGAVKERQRLAIVERAHLRHETAEQVERPVRLGDEAGERLPPIAAFRIIAAPDQRAARSEEHTSELQSLMSISYDVFCLKKTT